MIPLNILAFVAVCSSYILISDPLINFLINLTILATQIVNCILAVLLWSKVAEHPTSSIMRFHRGKDIKK